MECQGAIAHRMLVPALIAIAMIAQQKRAGREHRRSTHCSIFERAARDQRNAYPVVLFLVQADRADLHRREHPSRSNLVPRQLVEG